jgi:hypothetical protein
MADRQPAQRPEDKIAGSPLGRLVSAVRGPCIARLFGSVLLEAFDFSCQGKEAHC